MGGSLEADGTVIAGYSCTRDAVANPGLPSSRESARGRGRGWAQCALVSQEPAAAART